MTRPIAERDIQAEILAVIGSKPWCRLFRSGVGLARSLDGKRVVRYGFAKGASDLVGIVAPSGRFLAIEVKRNGAKPTDEQKAFLGMVEALGGIAVVATSVGDVQQALEAEGCWYE